MPGRGGRLTHVMDTPRPCGQGSILSADAVVAPVVPAGPDAPSGRDVRSRRTGGGGARMGLSNLFVRWVGALVALLVIATAARADVAQRHILDTAINLGWATENATRYGSSPAIRPDIARAMELAEAHVRALIAVPEPPYAQLDFTRILDRAATLRAAASRGADIGAETIFVMYRWLGSTVAQVYDRRAQRWVGGNSCDQVFVEVGYWFGRGHVAGLHKDHYNRSLYHWRMRQEIDRGIALAARTGCAFGTQADWARLPAETDNPTPEDFGATLTRIQEIALGARAATAAADPDPDPDPPAGRCVDLVGVTREDQLGGTMGSDADLSGPVTQVALRAVAPYGEPVQFDIRWTSLPPRICVGRPVEIAMRIDNLMPSQGRGPGVSIGVVVNGPAQYVTTACTNPGAYQATLLSVDGGERDGANTCTLTFSQIPDVALAQRWLIRVRVVAAVGGEGWLWYEYQ